MSNLLLITDVARLRKIFGRLTEDRNVRLRVVNNLEKGGEEIAIEKPDVVFVQTHLSGLSADILLMHLKKQLGRKRSRFVLLAPQSQINGGTVKLYQGWLDTSAEDSQFLSELHLLLATLLGKTKKTIATAPPESIAANDFSQQPVSNAESTALLDPPSTPEAVIPRQVDRRLQFPVVPPVAPEPSLEDQGITYAPRQRLAVYSEFNTSFDSAVSTTPEPIALDQAPSAVTREWNIDVDDTIEAPPAPRSKRGTFLLWLAPVIIAVIVITYLQQQKSTPTQAKAAAKPAPVAVVKPAAPQPIVPAVPATEPAPAPPVAAAIPAVTATKQEQANDKAVLTDISKKREQIQPPPPAAAPTAAPTAARLTELPRFIPAAGIDKKYAETNPGWELYKGQVTEFKVLREAQKIKAIQVIDRGWRGGLSEPFLNRALHQVTTNPSFSIDTTEKKEGYEIQRGKVAANINAVYYRDEKNKKLRAFVLTWQ